MVWAMLYPPGWPLQITNYTKSFYNRIEDLPPGSKVLYTFGLTAGAWGSYYPGTIAQVQHLFSRDIKIFVASFEAPECQSHWQTRILPELDLHGKEYGTDWVFTGYVAGRETGMSVFAQDFTMPVKDVYGTLMEDLPLLKEMRTLEDVDLIVANQPGLWKQCIRQFTIPYDKPTLMSCSTMRIPQLVPYFPDFIAGILVDLGGAAQYEILINRPGQAGPAVDALSFVHVFLLGLILVTNLVYISSRASRGE
jgi:hypothetical protein